MTAGDAKKLSDIIIKDMQPFHVTITGGEPLLNPEIVYLLAKEFKQKGVFYNLNTNLILLEDKILDNLLEASTNSKFGILTSLPHFKDDKYELITSKNNLNKFYRNLENIAKNTNLLLTVNMVVHKLNFDAVYEEGKFLHEKYGIKNFAATPVIVPAKLSNSKFGNYALNTTEIVQLLENLLKLHDDFGMEVDSLETLPRCILPEEIRNNSLDLFRRACSAGRSTLSIDYKGNVRACSHAPILEGNLLTDGFRTIWDTRLMSYRKNAYVPADCKDCAEFLSCYGGCRFYNYQEGDALNNPDLRVGTAKPIRTAIKSSRKLPKLTEKDYKLNPNTVYRKEKDDLYSFFNGRFANVLFVNEEFKNFVTGLKNLGDFNPSKLLNHAHNNEERMQVETMLRTLADKRFLV